MKISIIGGGNLGISIAKGIKEAESSYNISVSRRNVHEIKHLEDLGIKVTGSNIECISDSEIIILSIKPHQTEEVLLEIKSLLKNQILISVVTGYTFDKIIKNLNDSISVFRAMPNTAISFRESMTCISNFNGSQEQKKIVESLFNKLGECVFIEEKLMDAATVLDACGVAFALRYIRAAMQGGIQIGFDSETSLKIVSQTVKGAATLLLKDTAHPEREIDKVTTPQGCTIAGLNEMEHQGFSSALIKGIVTSYLAIGDITGKSK
ncbi:MAG: pyrroline-5-carboxylate reductase [bacterium]